MAASSVIAPESTLPENPIQSEDLMLSPVAIETGSITTISVANTMGNEISHSGLRPGRLLLFIAGQPDVRFDNLSRGLAAGALKPPARAWLSSQIGPPSSTGRRMASLSTGCRARSARL